MRMKKNIHEELIDVLKDHTQEGENTVDVLTDIIPISKEAAYRRLRGDIQFTLEEAVLIVEKTGISLDKILNIDKKGQYVFHAQSIFSEDPYEKYCRQMQELTSIYVHVKKDPDAMMYFAGNSLLALFYMSYEMTNKYAFLKWLYHMPNVNGVPTRLKDIVIPDKVINIQRKLLQEIDQTNYCLIIDKNVVSSFIKEIQYFVAAGLIMPEEVAVLKQEIALMLDRIEATAISSCSSTGKQRILYICNSYLEGNYSVLRGMGTEVAFIYLYDINQFNCYDTRLYKNQMSWIESIIGFSTLISGCGILPRIQFLTRQREKLSSL